MRSTLTTILATGPWKPEFWLEKAGASAAWVIAAIIFAESGLFFGFFLPGDSLLFMAGFLTSAGAHDFVSTFTREDSRLFKQSHVTKAHLFLEKHGPKTIFLARFVPIVRTFAPIVAGVGA